MIKSVSESFQRTPSTVEPVSITPAVSVRKSVTPTHITCLICGRPHKTLRRHLGTAHGMNPNDYRAEFGLSRDYPMVAPAYAEARSVMAKRIGLGRKPQAKTATPVAAFRRKRASQAGRKSVVKGKTVSVRGELGGRRSRKK